MFVGTRVTQGTETFAEGFADGAAGVEAKTVFAFQEVCESKTVNRTSRDIGR